MITCPVRTRRHRELIDITELIARALGDHAAKDGVWLVHVPHTTAGITINEGADPAVARDLLKAFESQVPAGVDWEHAEGNSPAHVMASLAGSAALVPVENGAPRLGTWQSIFLCEFDGPRRREVWLTPTG